MKRRDKVKLQTLQLNKWTFQQPKNSMVQGRNWWQEWHTMTEDTSYDPLLCSSIVAVLYRLVSWEPAGRWALDSSQVSPHPTLTVITYSSVKVPNAIHNASAKSPIIAVDIISELSVQWQWHKHSQCAIQRLYGPETGCSSSDQSRDRQ